MERKITAPAHQVLTLRPEAVVIIIQEVLPAAVAAAVLPEQDKKKLVCLFSLQLVAVFSSD